MSCIFKLEGRWRACCLLAFILPFFQLHFYFQMCLLCFFPFSYPPSPRSSAIFLLLRVTDSLSFWYVCKCYPSFYYTLVTYVFYVLFAISIVINVDGGGYGSHLSFTAICQESLTHPPRISIDFRSVMKISEENSDRDSTSCDIYLGKTRQHRFRQFHFDQVSQYN